MSGSSATRRPAQKKRSRSTGGSLRSTTRARTRHRLHGHRTGPFVGLLTLVTILCLGGLVMVLSASSVAALDDLGDSYYFFKRQLLWLVIGAVAMVATMRLDYRIWRRFALPIAIVAVIALLLVLIPQIGISVNGSRRWLGAGPLRFQPSELAKLAVLLFSADLLARRGTRMAEAHLTIRPVLAVAAALTGLVVIEDLGTGIVIMVTVLGVLWMAGAPALQLGGVSLGFIAAGAALALYEPYRRARLTGFLDPWDDVRGTGWQTIQSLVGVASGGVFGVGLGASRAKWGFLPFAHTDFIFAVIAEELGLVGALSVVAMFLAVAFLGFRVAAQAPDRFGSLLAGGVTLWILTQALVNIGGVLGLLPVTGVTLPFISSGGSSLVVTMVATGMLLSVARHAK